MADLDINAGYMGAAKFGDSFLKFESCTVAAKQDVNAPDLIMGSPWRMAYNYGKVEISGSISGPVTKSFSAGTGSAWSLATGRDGCGKLTPTSLSVLYYCDGAGYTFNPVKVNSITFSCAAGEVAQFSIDVIGASAPSDGGTAHAGEIDKLVTWDKVAVSVAASNGQQFDSTLFSNFEITFNNNVTAVYAIGEGMDYYPAALVDGLASITGSVSVYNVPTGMKGVNSYDGLDEGDIGNINFSVGGSSLSAKVQWHRVEPTSSVGPLISTVAFTGVGDQTNA